MSFNVENGNLRKGWKTNKQNQRLKVIFIFVKKIDLCNKIKLEGPPADQPGAGGCYDTFAKLWD